MGFKDSNSNSPPQESQTYGSILRFLTLITLILLYEYDIFGRLFEFSRLMVVSSFDLVSKQIYIFQKGISIRLKNGISFSSPSIN